MSGSAFFLSYALVKGLNKSFAVAVLVFLAAAAPAGHVAIQLVHG